MYATSPGFGTAIHAPGRTMRSLLAVTGGPELNDTVIQSIQIKRAAVPDSGFTLGGALAAQISLRLLDPDGAFVPDDFTGKELTLSIGAQLADESIEYVPMGIFTADQPVRKEAALEIVAYDRMVQLEKPYTSALTYPATVGDILLEVAAQAAVELVSASILNADLLIAAPIEGVTLRQMAGFIAEVAVGWARFTREGRLEIVQIASTPVVEAITPANYIPPMTVADEAWWADGVTVKTTAEDVGETHGAATRPWAIIGNPLLADFPEAAIGNIVLALEGVALWPYSVQWQGNPALDPGDPITITDHKTGTTRSTIAGTEVLNYTGGLRSTLALAAPSAQQQATDAQINAGKQTSILSRAYTLIKRTTDQISLFVADLGDRMSQAEVALTPTSIRAAVGRTGGANHVRNGRAEFGARSWAVSGTPVSAGVAHATLLGRDVFRVQTDGPDQWLTQTVAGLQVGKAYTVTALVYGAGAKVMVNNAGGWQQAVCTGEEFQQLWFTFTAAEAATTLFIGASGAGVTGWFTDIMLGEGALPLGWTPHAGELKSSAVQITEDEITMHSSKFALSILDPADPEVVRASLNANAADGFAFDRADIRRLSSDSVVQVYDGPAEVYVGAGREYPNLCAWFDRHKGYHLPYQVGLYYHSSDTAAWKSEGVIEILRLSGASLFINGSGKQINARFKIRNCCNPYILIDGGTWACPDTADTMADVVGGQFVILRNCKLYGGATGSSNGANWGAVADYGARLYIENVEMYKMRTEGMRCNRGAQITALNTKGMPHYASSPSAACNAYAGGRIVLAGTRMHGPLLASSNGEIISAGTTVDSGSAPAPPPPQTTITRALTLRTYRNGSWRTDGAAANQALQGDYTGDGNNIGHFFPVSALPGGTVTRATLSITRVAGGNSGKRAPRVGASDRTAASGAPTITALADKTGVAINETVALDVKDQVQAIMGTGRALAIYITSGLADRYMRISAATLEVTYTP